MTVACVCVYVNSDRRNAVMARESYVYDFVHLVDYAVNRRKKHRIGIVFPKSEITNTFDLAKPALDALDLSFVVNISTDSRLLFPCHHLCLSARQKKKVCIILVNRKRRRIRVHDEAVLQHSR